MKDYQLIEIVCKVSKLSIKNLMSESRQQEFVDARWLSFSLLHKYTELTDIEIGMLFGVSKGTVATGIKKEIKAMWSYSQTGRKSNLAKISIKSKEEIFKLINK